MIFNIIDDQLTELEGTYNTKSFSEVYPDVTTFLSDYNTIGIPATIQQQTATTLYYLLIGRYANSHILSSDENRFKYRLFSMIWQYAPAWEKKLDIQKKVRELTDEDIFIGSKQIYNSARNPDTTAPEGKEELQYISDQTVSKTRRGKVDGYLALWELVKNDVSEEFLNRFRHLFRVFASPDLPLWYVEN